MRSKELAIIVFLLSAMLLFYVVGRLRDMNNRAVSLETAKPPVPQNYTGRLLSPPQPAPDDSSAQQVQQQIIQAVQQLVSSNIVNIVSGRTMSLPMPVYTGSSRALGTQKTAGQTQQTSGAKAPSSRKLTTAQAPPPVPGTAPVSPAIAALSAALAGQQQQSAAATQACREVGSKCSVNEDCCNKRCSGGYCLKQLRVTRINFPSQQQPFGHTRR